MNFFNVVDRFFSNYLTSGLGFQLGYESTNVSEWSYSSGKCGGSFTTPNGIIASPSNLENYPDIADCIYIISQSTGAVILLNFFQMDVDCYAVDGSNKMQKQYLEIRDGPSEASPLSAQLCNQKENPGAIQSNQNGLWMRQG